MSMCFLKVSIISMCCASNLGSSPPVAIFADYDSCFDILDPHVWEARSKEIDISEQFFKRHKIVSKARNARKLLQGYLNQITRDREVYLFVGSSRQSLKFDLAMSKNPGTLSAIGGGGFEAIAEDTTWKKHKWKMNYALVADVGEKGASRWEKDTKGSAWINASLCQPIELGAYSTELDDQQLKVMLVENNFLQLKREYGPVEVYFFDDKTSNLDYTRAHARVPKHITFHTVHFDHLTYIQQAHSHPLISRKAIPALVVPKIPIRRRNSIEIIADHFEVITDRVCARLTGDGKSPSKSSLAARIWARLTGASESSSDSSFTAGLHAQPRNQFTSTSSVPHV